MDFLRNKEVKCQLIVSGAMSAIWGFAGCVMAGSNGVLVLAACLSLCVTSLIFTYRRLLKIPSLITKR